MKRLAALLCATALLGGCNLDILNPAEKTKEAAAKLKGELNKLRVMVTDTLNIQYKEVWVLLYKLEAQDADGKSVVFYDNPKGKALNVTTRNGVAELLNITQIQDGTYSGFSATLGAGVTIVKANGSTVKTTFPGSTDQVALNVPGTVTIAQGSIGAVALNFDTQNFVLNAQNQLEPALNLITDTTAFNRLYGTLTGTVVSIDVNADQITLQPPGGPQVTVTVPGFASIVNELSGATGLTLADISLGDLIRIFGNFNPDQLQVEATSVAVEALQAEEGRQTEVVGRPVEAEGFVVSVDSATAGLVLDIDEASFLPEDDQINVINLDNAVYSRGTQTMLAAGKEVEIRGTWDGSNLTATLIEIEGAPSSGSFMPETTTGELAEVDGTVTSLNGQSLTIEVTDAEHIGLTPGDSLTVDLTNAWFKQGNPACLIAGTDVELKGIVPATDTMTLDVSQIEVDSCATVPGGDDEEASDDTQDGAGNDDENEEDNDDH